MSGELECNSSGSSWEWVSSDGTCVNEDDLAERWWFGVKFTTLGAEILKLKLYI